MNEEISILISLTVNLELGALQREITWLVTWSVTWLISWSVTHETWAESNTCSMKLDWNAHMITCHVISGPVITWPQTIPWGRWWDCRSFPVLSPVGIWLSCGCRLGGVADWSCSSFDQTVAYEEVSWPAQGWNIPLPVYGLLEERERERWQEREREGERRDNLDSYVKETLAA